jgi:hypothetical protein
MWEVAGLVTAKPEEKQLPARGMEGKALTVFRKLVKIPFLQRFDPYVNIR